METLSILHHLDKKLPHLSNLRTKAESISKGKSNIDKGVAASLVEMYTNYMEEIDSNNIEDSRQWLTKSLPYFEAYYDKIKTPEYKVFSHQSDFLSSVFPEFLYIIYKKFIVSRYTGVSGETQKDIVIDVSFLPHTDQEIYCKKKRVDVAILKPCPLEVNHKKINFQIPLVAVEVKTNLDKNMISGVEYSVQRLKRTFPHSKYYLISEFADFATEKQNYASSSIDEILITRLQKRSEVRNNKTKINSINIDLLVNHIDEINAYLEGNVHQPLRLKDRMLKGKLIK